MKKILIIALLGILFLVGCSNNDIDVNNQANKSGEKLEQVVVDDILVNKCKNNFEKYLKLISFKEGSPEQVVVELGLASSEEMDALQNVIKIDNVSYSKTNITYDLFEKEILKYMDKNLYEQHFMNYYKNSEGYLAIILGGATSSDYNIKDFKYKSISGEFLLFDVTYYELIPTHVDYDTYIEDKLNVMFKNINNNYVVYSLEATETQIYKNLELNKTLLSDILPFGVQGDLSQYDDKTEKWLVNYEIGSYLIGKVIFNGQSQSLVLTVDDTDEVEGASYLDEVGLVLVNENGEQNALYSNMYGEFFQYIYDIGLEITIFDDYLIVFSKDTHDADSEILKIYDKNIELIINENVYDGYEINEDRIEFSKYEYFTNDELNMYQIPEQNNLYRQDYEIIEENDKLKVNKIKDDYTDYSFSAQVM